MSKTLTLRLDDDTYDSFARAAKAEKPVHRQPHPDRCVAPSSRATVRGRCGTGRDPGRGRSPGADPPGLARCPGATGTLR